MPARVGLLLVGHVDERARHIAGDYVHLFGSLLGPVGVEIVPYALDEGRFPTSLDECAGWICSPSRASVSDDEPWIAPAEELHRRIIAEERAYVGICFGHQLLARALGGRVERAAEGWNVGVHDYDVVERLPWMDPPRGRLSLLASHEDQVVEVPADARLLAQEAHGSCPVAGLVVGERAWTLQAHPEFVSPLAEHLLRLRVDLIGEAKVDPALASLGRPLHSPVVAQWVARFFDDVAG